MPGTATTYRFGSFELSLAQRALRAAGSTLSIGSRAFDLLVALVERRGRVVAKDELLDLVWGRVVVEEGNLHVHISALRKLLGAATIATVPGRGYQFSPPWPVESAANGDAVAAPADAAAAVATTAPGAALPVLFGRDDDLAAVLTLVAANPLVTITGAGGIGKTRLGHAVLAQASARQADGAAMVELAALSDPALVPSAVAAALHLQLNGANEPLAALADAARSLRMLVLLDNAEHLADEVARVAQGLLGAGSELRLLVTSQTPLKIPGEQVYRLGGLAVPADTGRTPEVAEALRCGALALLNERLAAADRHFRLTAANLAPAITICRRLDGIALAIELAAARCRVLGLQAVADRLDERLRLLAASQRSGPSRHQTLLAAMDWSHGLLSAEQATAFRQLSVFAGGFGLALAAEVVDVAGLDEWSRVDLLADLVDRSLVNVDSEAAESAPIRYRLLETSRSYGLVKLDAAGEAEATRRRHANAVRRLFETAYEESWQLPEADFLARYESDLDNLRAALDWSLQHELATAVALAGASTRLWRGLSLHPEARRRFARVSEALDATIAEPLAARLWEGIAQLSGETASPESRSAALEAAARYRRLGDARGLYLSLAHLAFSYRANHVEAESAFAEMQTLEDASWPPSLRLYGRKVEGGLASDAGRIDAARAANEGRLALGLAAGSERDVNAALGNLAEIALMAGDAARSVELGRQLLARLGQRQRTTRVIALGNLLTALMELGAVDAARDVLAEYVDLARHFDSMYVMYASDSMAWLAAAQGRWNSAAMLIGYSDASYAAQGQAREPNERRAREAAQALLEAGDGREQLAAGMAAGATLQAADACAVAMQT